MMRTRRIPLLIFAMLSVVAWTYVILRSVQVGITHDEALSWRLFMGDFAHLKTANTHWMNTLLAWIPGVLSGYEAWALRLPNVLSFGLLLWFLFRITIHQSTPWYLLFPIWCFIILNHYVLELYGLFRGYGLAVSGCIVAYWYAQKLLQNFIHSNLLKFQMACLFTLYSNYAFLYPVLALHIAVLYEYWIKRRPDPLPPDFLKLYGWFIPAYLPALFNLWQLYRRNELYFGGTNGFIEDTLISIFHYSFQFELYPNQNQIFLSCFLGIGFLLAVYSLRYKKMQLGLLVVLLCVLIPILLHHLVGVKFPMERSVLFMTLFMGISLGEWVGDCYREGRKSWLVTGMIPLMFLSSATVYGAYYRFNLRYASTWYYDEHNQQAMALMLNHSESDRLSVGISWVLEPSLNYFREQKQHDRFMSFSRSSLETGGHDYYYIFEDELSRIQGSYEKIQHFPDTKMLLLKEVPAFE